jgi:hypothetical protein
MSSPRLSANPTPPTPPPAFASQSIRRQAATGELDQRAGLCGTGARDGSAAQQVAGSQIAPAGRVVGDHLRDAPVLVPETGGGQPLRSTASRPIGSGLEQHLQLHIEGTALPHGPCIEVGQRLRLVGGTAPWQPVGCQRLHGDDPGRQRGGEVLGLERSKRRRFPTLDVSGGPIVQKAEAKRMIIGLGHSDRLAQGVARADIDAQLQLVVQALRRTVQRRRRPLRQPQAARAADALAGEANAGDAAVIGDGHPAEIRGQRIVGAVEPADVQRVVHGGVEVRVVADVYREGVRGAGQRYQARLAGMARRRWRIVAKQRKDPMTQSPPGRPAHLEQCVQAGSRSRPRCLGRKPLQQRAGRERREVQDPVADGDAAAKRAPGVGRPEDRQGQVLQREIAHRSGRAHPASSRPFVRVIQLSHRHRAPRAG